MLACQLPRGCSPKGTTAAVAKRLGRDYITIEQDEHYAKTIRQRLKKTPVASDEEILEHSTAKRKEPRIPFGSLVERGLLAPGTILYSPCKRHSAKVRVDGSLITDRYRGSIHQVGAMVQGAPSCNGWTYWMIETDHHPIPIDLLRQKLRQEIFGN